MTLLLFLGGLLALILGAELLVRGASKLALSLGISPLVVGLTIVAFGTSSPELAVSVGAALDGQTDIAVGNVVGSNVFNVLFILGVAASITPLAVHRQIIRQEVPIMIAVSALMLGLSLDGKISWLDGAGLTALLLAYTTFLIVQSRRAEAMSVAAGAETAPPDRKTWDSRLPVQLMLIAAGLVLLVFGSDWLVRAAVIVAQALGVSDVVIGLTIVAAGTSLPEVAASVAAALKRERDIAVGNVVGSNIFNLLGCLGLSSLASGQVGLGVPPSLLAFDLWVMLAVAVACLPIFVTGREIARWEGGVFLFAYVAYVTCLVLAARYPSAFGTFSTALLGFVLPLVGITLVVVMFRRKRAP